MKLNPQPVIPVTHPFVWNKYTQWYFSIISISANRQIPSDIYTEIHHIIPKCLKGTNHPSNLARLTAREHYVCHLLLPKITIGKDKDKMTYALWRMCCVGEDEKRHKVTASMYGKIRSEIVVLQKNKVVSVETRDKIKEARALQVITDETRIKMSNAHTGKPSHRKGKKLPTEHVNNVRLSRIGKSYWNNGTSVVMSIDCPGEGWVLGSLIKWTEERRIKTKQSQQGKKWYNNGQQEVCSQIDPGEGWRRGRLPKK